MTLPWTGNKGHRAHSSAFSPNPKSHKVWDSTHKKLDERPNELVTAHMNHRETALSFAHTRNRQTDTDTGKPRDAALICVIHFITRTFCRHFVPSQGLDFAVNYNTSVTSVIQEKPVKSAKKNFGTERKLIFCTPPSASIRKKAALFRLCWDKCRLRIGSKEVWEFPAWKTYFAQTIYPVRNHHRSMDQNYW